MKTETVKVKDIDWTKVLTKEQMKAINTVLGIIKSNPSADVRLERAAEETRNPEVDDTKDPYMYIHDVTHNVEIVSDGQIKKGDVYGGGGQYYRPTVVSNYNYIVEKTKSKNKVINLSIVLKTYPMKIYFMMEMTRPKDL
jgi:hypothetical protein